MSTSFGFEPLPQTRRGWVALVVTGVLFVVAFFLVVRFYDAEGGSTTTGASTVVDGVDGVVVTVEPILVDANVNEARVHLRFAAQGPNLVDTQDGRLTQNVRVTITDPSGVTEYKFPSGTLAGQRDQVIGLDGDSSQYPFDLHESALLFTAETYTKNADGSLTSVDSFPVQLEGQGGVNGWNAQISLSPSVDVSLPSLASLTFTRAFSTQVFALLIIAIAGVLALMTLVTAALVQANRRPAEAALLSWTAALLFALPALRNYLPNGPPFGASIDMYAYLWFMLAAGVASVLVVVGWNGQRLAERHRLERDQAKAVSGSGGSHAT